MLRFVAAFSFASASRAARLQVDIEAAETAAEVDGETASEAETETRVRSYRCNPSRQFPNTVVLRNVESDRLLYDNDGRVGANAGEERQRHQWCIEDAGHRQYTITNLQSANRLYHESGSRVGAAPAAESCTFETYGNGGAPSPSQGGNRCGTQHGASDTASPMCDGSTSNGKLYISEEEVQARCGADAACVGYSEHIRSRTPWGEVRGGYFRPHMRLEGIIRDSQWTTHEKICSTRTEESWFIEPDAENKFVIRNVHSGGRLFAQSNRNSRNGFGVISDDSAFPDQMWTTA